MPASVASSALRTQSRTSVRFTPRLAATRATPIRRGTGRRDGRSGSVTAIQRYGSALQLNLHFHVLHLDGVYDRGADGSLRFFHAAPGTGDVEALVERVGVRTTMPTTRSA